MKIIKLASSEIVVPLQYIFNLSLETGQFPENMKIAKVNPVYKNGNISKIEN